MFALTVCSYVLLAMAILFGGSTFVMLCMALDPDESQWED